MHIGDEVTAMIAKTSVAFGRPRAHILNRSETRLDTKLKFFKWAASWQNQQNGMCAQQRLRSAWASAQSDQSLCCPHEESLGP